MAPKKAAPANRARKSAKETAPTKKPTAVKESTSPSAATRKPTARQAKMTENDEEAAAKASIAKANTAAKRTPATTRPKATPTGATKKAPAKKAAATQKPETKTSKPITKKEPTKPTSKKRVSSDDEDSDEPQEDKRRTKRARTEDKPAAPKKPARVVKPKAVKAPAPRKVINTVPTTLHHIYVMGDGSAGELGLGAVRRATDVKRPRLNPILEEKGIVNISVGGMHSIALTKDNEILTWGVNDNKALGRDTQWEGRTVSADASTREDADSDAESEDSDAGMDLNPIEATPTAVSADHFPAGTKFVQVVAGDSASFVLTDDGFVYGWGTFRDDKGIFGFLQIKGHEVVEEQKTPILIKGLKNIKQISCGENHALALDDKGVVYAWGCGKQDQLGRRLVGRHLENNLNPAPLALPKRNRIGSVFAGPNHSFAVEKDGSVWTWGLNNFAQTGIPYSDDKDDDIITAPTKVKNLENIQMMGTGAAHSVALNTDGDLLAFGRIPNFALGVDWKQYEDDETMVRKGGVRNEAKILLQPVKVPIEAKCKFIACGADHNIAITTDGKAYSWGFNTSFQCGQGDDLDEIEEPTLIDNTAVRNTQLDWAGCGGQFSMLGSAIEGVQST